MQVLALTLDGTAQQLTTFATVNGEHCRFITLENILGNSTMFWGDSVNQIMTLAAGDKISIPVTAIKNLWVKGTNTDVFNVAIFG